MYKTKYFKNILLCLFIIFIAACSSIDSSTGSYQSMKVYEKPIYSDVVKKSMEYEGIARNPVIVVHGFLGSKLDNIKTGKNVWGTFTGYEVINGFSNTQLSNLKYPMIYDKPLNDIQDNVKAVKMLTKFNVKIMGMEFQINAYNKMLDILINAGYIPENLVKEKGKKYATLFPFYYDWRRDNVENAVELHKYIMKKRKYMQKQYNKYYGISNYNVQFDVVSHSMGGLVSRYYLRYGNQEITEDKTPELNWAGSKYIDKLVIIGTPNEGYLDTCFELTRGLKLDSGLPAYPPAVIGTWPSYYQMMPFISTKSVMYKDDPKGKPVNLYDVEVWKNLKWGLADPDQDEVLKRILPNIKTSEERRKIALNHLGKCLRKARKFNNAMKLEGTPPDDVGLFLFLGDAVETRREAVVDKKNGFLTVTKFDAGDGKILASSARMDMREGEKWVPFLISPIKWQVVVHLKAAHMGITECYSFADNVTYYLLVTPTKKQLTSRKYVNHILKTEDRLLDKNK
ncbi:MAG TPA: hypothetical protein QF753_11095 [Victivallales bacterium]|nr:hypothetical protein [Victivallales bacterium]